MCGLVERGIESEKVEGMGIEIVGINKTPRGIDGGDGKGTDACKRITNDLALLEGPDESIVLGSKTRVPIDLSKVETESMAVFNDLSLHVVFSCNHLHLEGPELCLDLADLCDDGACSGRFLDRIKVKRSTKKRSRRDQEEIKRRTRGDQEKDKR